MLKPMGNTLNTNVMVKGGRLYALYEASKPAELDPVTLETLGESDLGGIQALYSAHPTTDPATGETFNIGTGGAKGALELTRLSPDGTLEQSASFTPPAVLYWHDNTLTKDFFIAVTSPFVASLKSVFRALLGFGHIGNSFKWDDSMKSEVLVLFQQIYCPPIRLVFASMLKARQPLCLQAYLKHSSLHASSAVCCIPPFPRSFLHLTGVFLLQRHVGVGKTSGTSWLTFVLPHRKRLPRGGGGRHDDRDDRQAPRRRPR